MAYVDIDLDDVWCEADTYDKQAFVDSNFDELKELLNDSDDELQSDENNRSYSNRLDALISLYKENYTHIDPQHLCELIIQEFSR